MTLLNNIERFKQFIFSTATVTPDQEMEYRAIGICSCGQPKFTCPKQGNAHHTCSNHGEPRREENLIKTTVTLVAFYAWVPERQEHLLNSVSKTIL